MSPNRYTNTTIALHWLVAALIVGAFPLGVYMADMPLSPLKLQLFSYHKWLGVTIFLLALARLAWRAAHPPPALPATVPAWQQRAAHGVHFMLYLLPLAIPLTGWLMSSAKGFQTVYFGVLPLPDLVGRDKALADLFQQLHVTLNLALALLVLGHVSAALKHQFIERDGILARMLPFLDKGSLR